jgi:hypothetical protein
MPVRSRSRSLKYKKNRSIFRKIRKNRKTRRIKKGGAADNQTFDSLGELNNYLNNNKQWIERVDVYTKDQYKNNQRPTYKFVKAQFSELYEVGDVKNYVFQFY